MTLERWQKASEWPLIGAALIFLVAYSIQVIANLSDAEGFWADAVVWASWAVFAVDYAARLWLAPQRGRWFVMNLHELAILALPALRPLRLLRLVLLLKLIHTRAGNALRGKILSYVFGAAAILVYCGALAALDAEQNDPQANIKTFGDALWWALATITTVGYGDHYPVTLVGRLAAAGLMVAGIAVLGVVTASIASWLVETVSTEAAEKSAEETAAALEPLEALEERIEVLTRQVELLTAVLARTTDGARAEPQEDRTS
ncbi:MULTISPECIES: potassium channel family protein [Arthrobacter]|uniref:Potassium channel family protein n=2 Tax=Arthrobacter TaxID=1663 RepID=A0ABU9KHQ7_9MICC|nr:potassium channel family protein [Arthrobacter sp. YJM1]MDP5225737.1 potassium channel family protein [Arthrobacter sp. YJM1]